MGVVPQGVVNDLGIAGQLRVALAEQLQNQLGVAVVLGKEDGFANAAAVIHPQAVGHQGVQHLEDGVLVKDPLIEGGGGDAVRGFPVLAEGLLVGGLVLVGKVVVDDALL